MKEDIERSCEVLKNGGLILYPTDTVWGIGCDATNFEAVKKIYDLKKRDDTKAMLVLMDTETRLTQYVKEVPEVAWQLLEVTDKPLTIIYPGAKNLATNLISTDESIGIRVASDEFCQRLISRFGKPVVSTSANISGEPSPKFFDEIAETIKIGMDYVVTWQQNNRQPTKPSSIIKLGLGGEIQIIRA